jgi:hypothetical protein
MRSQKAELIADDRLKSMQAEMDIAGPLINYAAKGNIARLSGKEFINGKEAFKINLTSNTGRDITYYIDADDYLLIQTRQLRAGIDGNMDEKEVITNYADYKPVDGVLFPHTVSNPGDGPVAGSVTFTNIEVNKAVDESQYKP